MRVECLRPNSERQNASFTPEWSKERADGVTRDIVATYRDEQGINHLDDTNMPESGEIVRLLTELLEICFPGYTGRRRVDRAGVAYFVGRAVSEVYRGLFDQIRRALAYRCRMDCCPGCDCARQAEKATIRLLETLPQLREMLKDDVRAALNGDPAATSPDEVVIAYPGVRTVAVHRIAHELYRTGIPMIPRVMSEYAHANTGIDIHPGARIGRSFFIDHGTGVVVGETAVVGRNVKLYQGVTLGALSFPKDERGRIIKGQKRHPNIEDNVTIYAGATILGNITVGEGSVIGGNVWLTESVPPRSRVTIAPAELSIRRRSESGLEPRTLDATGP